MHVNAYVVILSNFKLLLVHNLITHSKSITVHIIIILIIAFTLYVQDGGDLQVPQLIWLI